MATIGERIRQLRKEYNLTQEQFGKLFGIVKSTVSMYESNKSVPDDEMKKKIAEHFNISLDWLMGRTDIPNAYIPEEYTKKHKVTKRDLTQYEDFIKQAGIFFMNDEVTEEDKEKLFRDISELFWKAKEMNKKKYGRKKAKTDQ